MYIWTLWNCDVIWQRRACLTNPVTKLKDKCIFLWENNCAIIMFFLKGNAPHAEVSMLVGSHMMAGIPLAAGSHHKGFSDP